MDAISMLSDEINAKVSAKGNHDGGVRKVIYPKACRAFPSSITIERAPDMF
jgi:hypothetical protein